MCQRATSREQLPPFLTVISPFFLGPLGDIEAMRTSSECLARAVEMERRAAAASMPAVRLSYSQLALCWRELACVIASLSGRAALKTGE